MYRIRLKYDLESLSGYNKLGYVTQMLDRQFNGNPIFQTYKDAEMALMEIYNNIINSNMINKTFYIKMMNKNEIDLRSEFSKNKMTITIEEIYINRNYIPEKVEVCKAIYEERNNDAIDVCGKLRMNINDEEIEILSVTYNRFNNQIEADALLYLDSESIKFTDDLHITIEINEDNITEDSIETFRYVKSLIADSLI